MIFGVESGHVDLAKKNQISSSMLIGSTTTVLIITLGFGDSGLVQISNNTLRHRNVDRRLMPLNCASHH